MDDTQLLVALTGLAWSGLLALARRAVAGLEEKIDKNAEKVTRLQAQTASLIGDTKYRIERNFHDLVEESRLDIKALSERLEKVTGDRRIDKKLEDFQKETVSQSEFRLFIANLNAKVESIYEMIMKNGAKS
ncbi:hypothetical protein MNBD_NITROSPINAE04-848 [hydrothermal vent metagenome]|uniref:Uncharacterized protein n=1 Tax=hydrothermal vent metagenome TaxID=652676 RepID=A0A3B1BXI5_9ZZZZ